jgi:hypothetical protein
MKTREKIQTFFHLWKKKLTIFFTMENIFSNKYLHFTTSKKSMWDGFHVMVSTQQYPCGGNVHVVVIIIANAKQQMLF